MPQITVDHTPLSGFDRAAFAKELHTAVVEIAAAKPEACKSLFRTADHTAYAYGDDGAEHAIVHVTLGLLAGRTEETKAELTAAVLELVKKHVGEGGPVVHASAEVRELDPSYKKF